jgi:hypothetical protein
LRDATLARAAVSEQSLPDADLEHVAGAGADVHELVVGVHGDAVCDAAKEAELAVKGSQLSLRGFELPDSQVVVSAGNDAVGCVVEKLDGVDVVIGGGAPAHSLPCVDVPDNKAVVVFATKGGKESVVKAKCEGLDLHLCLHMHTWSQSTLKVVTTLTRVDSQYRGTSETKNVQLSRCKGQIY